MLHRVLSVTSVKIVGCHNAIPHTLRERLIYVWQLSVVHLVTKSLTDFVFFSPLQNRLILTLPEDIIIQSKPKKQDKSHILEEKFQNLSDLELNFSQRVRFWFKSFTTPHFSDWKNYNVSDFKTIFQTCIRSRIECFPTCQISIVLLLLFAKFSIVHKNRKQGTYL